MTKIIFLDFDQTLYSHFTNCIPASAAKALNIAHEKGIKIFLCTGRSLCEMVNFDISMVNFDGMIANNGQVGYDSNDNVLFDYPISGKLKELLIDKYNKKTVPIFINTADSIMCNFVNDKVRQTQKDINSPIPPIKEYNNEKFYMSSAFYNNKEDWDDLLSLKEYANITYWHDGAVDIVPNDASKAIGIERILEYYHLSVQDAMAIGDSENDIEMLKYCGTSIAVGNAMESVKEVADFISSDIDDDGIYNALKHYQII